VLFPLAPPDSVCKVNISIGQAEVEALKFY